MQYKPDRDRLKMSKRKLFDQHLTSLRHEAVPANPHTTEETLEEGEPSRKLLKKYPVLHWVLSDETLQKVTDDDLNELIENGTVPENAIKLSLDNGRYTADLTTMFPHLFTGSWLMNGKIEYNQREVMIKISAKTCLGMREHNAFLDDVQGCLKILEMLSLSPCNIFIREYSGKSLTHYLACDNKKENDIEFGPIVVDLARAMRNVHDRDMGK